MDKTLQDLAWASLPKEVRSHIKAEYRSGLDNPRMDKCDSVYLTAFENTFGRHNLTSDIEPEEVLMVERKKVQEMRSYNLGVLKYDPTHKGAILLEQSLKRLFGNKCLPDELEQTLEQTSVKVEDSSIQVEDKPRFKVGDKVRISENPSYPHNKPSWVPDMDNFKGKVAILKGRDINGDWLIEESIYSFSERWFEPYTEEKGKQYGKTGKNSKFPYQEKNDMEEKELNLCELLKGCEGEKFYSLVVGECVLNGVVQSGTLYPIKLNSSFYVEDGRFTLAGAQVVYPSRALYEKYPLDAKKAWAEWAESRKPKR